MDASHVALLVLAGVYGTLFYLFFRSISKAKKQPPPKTPEQAMRSGRMSEWLSDIESK